MNHLAIQYDQDFYSWLCENVELLRQGICFDFVIRFRGCIKVTSADGERRAAHAWVRPSGKARRLVGADGCAAECREDPAAAGLNATTRPAR